MTHIVVPTIVRRSQIHLGFNIRDFYQAVGVARLSWTRSKRFESRSVEAECEGIRAIPFGERASPLVLFTLAVGCGGSDPTDTTTTSTTQATQTARSSLPAIHHVFVIVLENENFTQTFGSGSPATYLATQLTAQGTLLTNYYAIGHKVLGNYIRE